MQISNEIYKFFADYIYKQTGITYLEKDYYRLDSRFKDLMQFFELDNINDLYQKYKTNITPDMHAVLINFSTNNETYFFRDKKPFKALTEHILPALESKYGTGMLKIWCCASSTGQEPVSILMQLKDKANKDFARVVFKASDISKEALSKAKSGVYNGLDIQRGLPISLLMKHFEQQGEENNWKISSDILSKINYCEFNLLTDTFEKNAHHIIYCRNVLIYQDMDNKKVILQNIFDALKPGGYLILGNGESLIGINLPFDKETFDGLTLYRKPEE